MKRVKFLLNMETLPGSLCDNFTSALKSLYDLSNQISSMDWAVLAHRYTIPTENRRLTTGAVRTTHGSCQYRYFDFSNYGVGKFLALTQVRAPSAVDRRLHS